MLDDIECKIIKPAKAPNRDGEQRSDPQTWKFEDEQRGGKQADDQEHETFKLNQARIGEVSHKAKFSAEARERKQPRKVVAPARHGLGSLTFSPRDESDR
jgi:hypothetical protein